MSEVKSFVSNLLKNPKLPFANAEKVKGSAYPSTPAEPLWELPPPNPPRSKNPPRILIVGAGSRGHAYGRSILGATNGCVAAVAEPIDFKRRDLGRKCIWGVGEPREGEEFVGWKEFIAWELQRRAKKAKGEDVPVGVDAVFICTLDETHAEIIEELAPLGLHVLCEKPLATTLEDCLRIHKSLSGEDGQKAVFGIGHVLRYSPHNVLLRKLVVEEQAIGEVVSVEHTEPVGWWHFSHSYVRGNWRNESTSAPSLLTKSCHDIDLLLWLLCSPAPGAEDQTPHLPSYLTSTGQVTHFKPLRKPALAGRATNCLSCPAEPECQFSAKRIYIDNNLKKMNTGWPVKIVVPDIEECDNMAAAEEKLMKALAEDYDHKMPQKEVEKRAWYGRCVYEAGNDVCDDQVVTLTWTDDPTPSIAYTDSATPHVPPEAWARALKRRGAKTATFHMIAFTEAICERRTRIYGTTGELWADSREIKIHDFKTGETKVHRPHLAGGGHGGGDDGLARQFILAVDAVKNHGMSVGAAQKKFVGCDLAEVIRSHAMVFAAEEARQEMKVVEWEDWWRMRVDAVLKGGEAK